MSRALEKSRCTVPLSPSSMCGIRVFSLGGSCHEGGGGLDTVSYGNDGWEPFVYRLAESGHNVKRASGKAGATGEQLNL